jgi:hypothetical protein
MRLCRKCLHPEYYIYSHDDMIAHYILILNQVLFSTFKIIYHEHLNRSTYFAVKYMANISLYEYAMYQEILTILIML